MGVKNEIDILDTEIEKLSNKRLKLLRERLILNFIEVFKNSKSYSIEFIVRDYDRGGIYQLEFNDFDDFHSKILIIEDGLSK